jgi:hypothetical protein
LLALFLPVLARAETYLLIISGLPGEPAYQETLQDWAGQLIDYAGQAGLSEQRIIHLQTEPPAEAPYRVGLSDQAGIKQAIAELKQQVEAQDHLWIVLLGHGSEQRKRAENNSAEFNILGPDISAQQFAEWLAPLRPERLVFVAASSASGGFVSALAGPRRVLISATRSGAERYFAHFGGFWIQALDAEQGGDLDKNGKISLLEAFHYARREVERFYQSERRLQTEHALLDDNGDGQGSPEPMAEGEDGALAAQTFLVDYGDLASTDPEHADLLEQQTGLEQRLQAWRKRKSELSSDAYFEGLEQILVEIIAIDQALRVKEGEKKVL